jgi:hypothetical protein
MKYWGLLLAVVVITFAVIGIHNVREKLSQQKRSQQEREVAYQTALRSYSGVLRPGMTRKEVEDYLRARNTLFRQMCCVDLKKFSKSAYDDLVKIGQEDAPWVCSEKNIYVAFQFAGTEPHATAPTAEASDKLIAVTKYPWLEGCP